jgi:hypothetical protein
MKYKIGKKYRYSEIPEEDTEHFTVSDYGLGYLGQNAIHIRYHKTETDVWFIYEEQRNEGIFKCVYNS